MHRFLQSVYRCERQRCFCAENIHRAAEKILNSHSEYNDMENAVAHQKKCRSLSPWPTDDIYTANGRSESSGTVEKTQK